MPHAKKLGAIHFLFITGCCSKGFRPGMDFGAGVFNISEAGKTQVSVVVGVVFFEKPLRLLDFMVCRLRLALHLICQHNMRLQVVGHI